MIPTTAHAFEAAAEAFGIAPEQLYAEDRSVVAARPRFAAYLIARDLLGKSFPEIGRHVGRDHTTIMQGCRRAMALLETDAEFAAAFKRAHTNTNALSAIPVFRSRRAPSALKFSTRRAA